MYTRRVFNTIDTHTGGEPTRTVLSGVPVIPGSTMMEKYTYMMEHNDWIRRLLCLEPRGNAVMSGAFLTPPCREDADIGVMYFETGGWLPMCGHDTIGVCTALVETGMVKVEEPVTIIRLDTPSGLVTASVRVENGRAIEVSFENAPAFVMQRDVTVQTKEWGPVKCDISWGGNVYAILPAASLGLKLVPERSKEIVEKGVSFRDQINQQVKISHPELPFVNSVTHIEFYDESPNGADCRNAVIITSAAIDRSPCGTGTSAKLALLHAEGKLKVGQPFVHESLIGSIFNAHILRETEVAGIPAVIPVIGGRAFVSGMCSFFLDPEDPFPAGFSLD